MVKDLLVTALLSEQMITTGAKLITRLDKADSQVLGAFWIFSTENKLWRLIIASPLVDDDGPREYYKRIIAANKLANDNEYIISLHDVSALGMSEELVKLISSAITTTESISEIRFSRNAINGIFIEDAHIYRMNQIK